MTGGGEAARELGEKMSIAWVNFAKTGTPEAEGLPVWEAYTVEQGATMIFDTTSEIRYNHDKELLEVVRSFPVRGF